MGLAAEEMASEMGSAVEGSRAALEEAARPAVVSTVAEEATALPYRRNGDSRSCTPNCSC